MIMQPALVRGGAVFIQALRKQAKRTLFELSAVTGAMASCAIGWRKDPLVCRRCVSACVDWLGNLSFLCACTPSLVLL